MPTGAGGSCIQDSWNGSGGRPAAAEKNEAGFAIGGVGWGGSILLR